METLRTLMLVAAMSFVAHMSVVGALPGAVGGGVGAGAAAAFSPPPLPFPCNGGGCKVFIDCGSTANTTTKDLYNVFWQGDKYFNGGTVESTNVALKDIKGNRAFLYNSARVNPSSYAILVPANTYYQVNLHFIELYWQKEGMRLFNVTLQKNRVLTNFDIYKAAGGTAKPVVMSFLTYTTNKILTLNLSTVLGTPRISAIEVYATMGNLLSPPPSPPPSPPSPPSPPPPSPPSPPPPFHAKPGIFYQINAGANKAANDSLNTVWSADTKYYKNGAHAGGVGLGALVPGAADGQDFLYQSARAGKTFSYILPVKGPAPGAVAGPHYTFQFYFLEKQYIQAGKRVFDVIVDNKIAIPKLDIFAIAGKNTAVVKTYGLFASAANITITFNATVGEAIVYAISLY